MSGDSLHFSVLLCAIVFSPCGFANTVQRDRDNGGGATLTDYVDSDNEKVKMKLKVNEADRGFDITNDEMNKFKMWPGGIIPYFIDDLSFDKVFRDRLRIYLDETSSLTGLQFNELLTPPANKQERYVFFINRRSLLECVDYTTHDFSLTGAQKIVVGYDCLSNSGNLAGTILGLAGVPPMHTSPDRDQYIEVQSGNIESGKSNKFSKLSDHDWIFHGLDYDFNSAGHFHWHQYSGNGKATIKPKEKYIDIETTTSKKLSPLDVRKIKMLYNYISKKKNKSESIPECNQLFAPGEKFDDYPSPPEDDLKPLPKPSKYTGVKEKLDEPDEPNNPDKPDKKEETSKVTASDDNTTHKKGSVEKEKEKDNDNNINENDNGPKMQLGFKSNDSDE